MSSAPSLGDLYDWELTQLDKRDDDVDWLAALAGGGRVLELGCGTGRVAAALADRGADVVGLDLDPVMLGRAPRRPGLSLVCGDMQAFAFHTAFDLVAIPYNGLQLLLDADGRRACLAAAAAHVGRDGVVAFEVTDFVTGVVHTSVPHEPIASGPLGDVTVELQGALDVDLERWVTTYRRRFTMDPGPVLERDVALYTFRSGEVEELLANVGLAGEMSSPRTDVERWTARRIR